MSALEDRLRRFAYEWHEAMNSPYTVNMVPMLREAASDVRSLAAPSLEADNAKLRKLVDYMTPIALYEASEQERDRMRELGVDE